MSVFTEPDTFFDVITKKSPSLINNEGLLLRITVNYFNFANASFILFSASTKLSSDAAYDKRI